VNRRLQTSVPCFHSRAPRLVEHVSSWRGSGVALRFARRRPAASQRTGASHVPFGLWRRLFFVHPLVARGSRSVPLEPAVRRETVELPPEVRVRTLLREVKRVQYVTRAARERPAATPWHPRRHSPSPTTLHAQHRESRSAPVPGTAATQLRTMQYLVPTARVVREPLVDIRCVTERIALPPTAPSPTYVAPAAPAPPAPSPALPPAGAPVATPAPVRVEPSTGTPLSHALRRTIRRRLGFDPVRVRIHAGEPAHRAASELRAAAFTLGEHIYFARGRFDPATPAGRDLLVHELIHVRQQPEGRPFRAGELSPIRLAALEAEARGGAQPAPTPPRPPLVLAPNAGSSPAPAVPLLADETSSAVASPTPTEEPAPAAAAPGAAPPAPPSPPDARQVADEVYKLIERRLRIERERTGVQRWR
jgi:Domain of unknown function (DUF4157)